MSFSGSWRLQEQELRHHEVRVHVVDLAVHEDDPVLEEPGVDVVGPLSAPRLLDDDGDEVGVHLIHRDVLPLPHSFLNGT